MAPVAITAPGGTDPGSSRMKAKSAPATAMPSPPLASTVLPYASSGSTTPTNTASEAAELGIKSSSAAAAKAKVYVDIPARRPSPWHDLAHSLSTTSLPHHRSYAFTSGASSTSTPPIDADPNTARGAGKERNPPGPSPPLSTSQALREWEDRLSQPSSSYSRHTLIPPPTPPTPSPEMHPATTALVPKLAPESDSHGHIEYKLKLINPPAERFERLVTQMMWRLKQGHNEAIYELGLADDGTVVGLSRSDMDASLRTLELMASEVGATVLVLKEIVLAKSVLELARGESGASIGGASWSSRDDSPAGWVVPRRTSWAAPGPREFEGQSLADGNGLEPGASVAGPKTKKVKKRKSWKRRERRGLWTNGDAEQDDAISKERQIVFDLPTGSEGESSGDDDIIEVSEERRPQRIDRKQRPKAKPLDVDVGALRSDDDVPPFHLDLEDAPKPSTGKEWTTRYRANAKGRATPAHPNRLPPDEYARRSNAKARKAMERREARRLSLLRGDGMTPSPFDLLDDAVDEFAAGMSPHAPARPSSLRLVAPAPTLDATPRQIGMNDSAEDKEDEEDSAIIQDLLSLPLDSLSLSFADVRTVATSPPLSPASSSSTEYAPTMSMSARIALDDEEHVEELEDVDEKGGEDSGDERICVEALVVRKMLHEEDEDAWGWGGHDDGWGLSADQDGAPEGAAVRNEVGVDGEVDDGDDPWGFG